jgi:hypothetical protein
VHLNLEIFFFEAGRYHAHFIAGFRFGDVNAGREALQVVLAVHRIADETVEQIAEGAGHRGAQIGVILKHCHGCLVLGFSIKVTLAGSSSFLEKFIPNG